MTEPNEDVDDPFMLLLRERAVLSRKQQGIPFSQNEGGQNWPSRLAEPPTANNFKQIIEEHVPVLIEACMMGRPGLAKWKDTSYLESCMGPNRSVVVAITPDGRADDLIEHPEHGAPVFALPLEENMPFSELLTRLSEQAEGKADTIAYLQSQNSNLSVQEYGDLSPLLRDLELRAATEQTGTTGDNRSDLPWATQAIGYPPEATNIWIGTSSSRTSMHRDYYENLFTVVRGWKEFTVYPPAEACFLCDDEEYPVYKYIKEPTGQLELEGESGGATTRWIPVDPTLPKDAERNAPFVHRDLNLAEADGVLPRKHTPQTKYGYALPALKIRVHEGETLYLPSGWFHHVAQQQDSQVVSVQGQDSVERGLCLCLNWWYEISDDMAIQLDETSLTIAT
ncbi:JmjC [Kalmanozyma brasiliensis GHG001]|uniref:JmjC domain-containing protein n=1 Tax=Kalmanozyma brasiliensis (strain GHG001) TaxID=1365824 RepID=V5E7Y7_KALBG|nr:JmjC [Kalmanozyma brasiliensis GHG001]EST06436.1 JmjC [Kalmanozyma brasiliensis GHG001]